MRFPKRMETPYISSGGERMIASGEKKISDLFAGSMGIKAAYAGDNLIFYRESSYFYLELQINQEEFIPKESNFPLITLDNQEFFCKT